MIKYDEVNIHKCFPAVENTFHQKNNWLYTIDTIGKSILFLFIIWKPTNTVSRSIFKEAFTDDIGAKNEIDRDIIKHNIILLCFTTFVCKVILFLIASLRITIYSSAFCFMCHVNSPKCYLDNIKFRI